MRVRVRVRIRVRVRATCRKKRWWLQVVTGGGYKVVTHLSEEALVAAPVVSHDPASRVRLGLDTVLPVALHLG